MNEHEQASNYAEYSYEKRVEQSDKVKKFLFIAGAVVVFLIPIIIAMVLHFYWIMFVYLLLIIVGIPFMKFLFRYLQKEFKYIVERNDFKMQLMYGKSKPKTLFEADAKEMEFAVPATEENKAKYSEKDFDKVYTCCVFMGSPDLYMMGFKDKSGKRCLAYFEGSKKALKIMNYYNKNIELSSTLKH